MGARATGIFFAILALVPTAAYGFKLSDCGMHIANDLKKLGRVGVTVDFKAKDIGGADGMYFSDGRRIGIRDQKERNAAWKQLKTLRHEEVHARVDELAMKGIEHPLLGWITEHATGDAKLVNYLEGQHFDEILAFYRDIFTLTTFLKAKDLDAYTRSNLNSARDEALSRFDNFERDHAYLAEEALDALDDYTNPRSVDGISPYNFETQLYHGKKTTIATLRIPNTTIEFTIPLLQSRSADDLRNREFLRSRIIKMRDYSARLAQNLRKQLPEIDTRRADQAGWDNLLAAITGVENANSRKNRAEQSQRAAAEEEQRIRPLTIDETFGLAETERPEDFRMPAGLAAELSRPRPPPPPR